MNLYLQQNMKDIYNNHDNYNKFLDSHSDFFRRFDHMFTVYFRSDLHLFDSIQENYEAVRVIFRN